MIGLTDRGRGGQRVNYPMGGLVVVWFEDLSGFDNLDINRSFRRFINGKADEEGGLKTKSQACEAFATWLDEPQAGEYFKQKRGSSS